MILPPLFDTLEHLQSPPEIVPIDWSSIPVPEAEKEYTVSREFLLSYGGSSDTYVAYRREIERLLHWAWGVQQKSICTLDRHDLREYFAFSADPPREWIATKIAARFLDREGLRVPNPQWRPYVVRISKAERSRGKTPNREDYRPSSPSVQAMFAILSSYFTYLQQEEYLDVNPVSLIRQKRRYVQTHQTHQADRVTRKLSRVQWTFVLEAAESMAQENLAGKRTLFILSAFYLLGLRISELARHPVMGDFAPDKEGLWWFTTVGKGNKKRDVAVPDAMLQALKLYREALGLSPLPPRGDSHPLIPRLRGRGSLGSSFIRTLVQKCFDRAVTQLRLAGKEDEAEDLMVATVHWLRHTAISIDVEDRPREHVRDDVGHESAATTDRYIDVDRVARHQSARHKPLKPGKKI